MGENAEGMKMELEPFGMGTDHSDEGNCEGGCCEDNVEGTWG